METNVELRINIGKDSFVIEVNSDNGVSVSSVVKAAEILTKSHESRLRGWLMDLPEETK